MAQEKMTLEDWLDDLCVRFIINLPREDLSSVARICFQIEEAQWFYEDFIRPLDPALPSMSLRTFSLKMFQHCPLLASFSADSHLKAFDEFMQYKTRVPVRGAIMLNDTMDSVVLVRGYKKGASWSFPRGKINKDEDDVDCAVREVYEETGYDLRAAGLVEKNAPLHPLEVTMHEQQVRFYVFRGIPEDTVFETRTRKEIGDIKWYKLSDLPTFKKKKGAGKGQGPVASSQERFYMVAPFMVPLRQWILKQKVDVQNTPSYAGHNHPPAFYDENLTDDNMLHEPPPPPVSSSRHPEDMDSTTRELQRLLQLKPPTQGLQLPSSTSNQQAGQTLLSILQPKPGFGPGQLQSPHQEEVTNATPSFTPHHYQPQRVIAPDTSAPSSFSTHPSAAFDHSYNQQYLQHRPRPKVFITGEISQPSPKVEKPPVQLLHPQPLPPQVQKEMLLRDLRDLASSPNVPGAANQPTSVARGFHPVPANAQYQPRSDRGNDHHTRQPPQFTAHSTNLLNVLKGNSSPASTLQQLSSQSSPYTTNVPTRMDHQHQRHRVPTSEAGAPRQYGDSTVSPATFPSATISAPVPFSRDNSRPLIPTDQHRASLLDMFKTGQSTVSQSQVDGQGAGFSPVAPRTNHADSPSQQQQQQQQQRARQGPPAADVLKSTARENGHPIQWNPELNLPYGAHSILRRGGSQGSARSPASVPSARNPNEAAIHLPIRSHPSPSSSSRGHMSPRRQMSPRGQMSPYQGYLNARMQSPKQVVAQPQPHMTPSYPYGSNQGSAPNPLTQPQGTPPTSMLSTPGMIKPRQNSTVEHRNTLLSILGSSHPEANQSKSKDLTGSKPIAPGPGPMPRSRVASLASQESGRGNTVHLSPADRNFLLDFLENASSTTKS
ncbi:putative mRNA decapping complex subunit 2 [Rosellinia necatrix]|uniref:Putative mRNA decapping complex subunit 2 n=1 Tax=Rosellinia necatrix TaxID=77044 RepID=A0A1W2TLU5_ROSNE|nr:putative mRNA decapping complex subunit 2 [Rosellinia necatrix]